MNAKDDTKHHLVYVIDEQNLIETEIKDRHIITPIKGDIKKVNAKLTSFISTYNVTRDASDDMTKV
jgi:hypothetical protein